jgi:hypothetical protein
MPDYIYLLENRLSPDQQKALHQLREAVREAGTILFLTGDAVRDLTNGQAVRDLEITVHGNALNLKKPIEKLGGTVWGEDEVSQTLFLCFPAPSIPNRESQSFILLQFRKISGAGILPPTPWPSLSIKGRSGS